MTETKKPLEQVAEVRNWPSATHWPDDVVLPLADRIEKMERALRLAEHDQIDLLHVTREYAKETDPKHTALRQIRDLRADRVQDRLNITREALK